MILELLMADEKIILWSYDSQSLISNFLLLSWSLALWHCGTLALASLPESLQLVDSGVSTFGFNCQSLAGPSWGWGRVGGGQT